MKPGSGRGDQGTVSIDHCSGTSILRPMSLTLLPVGLFPWILVVEQLEKYLVMPNRHMVMIHDRIPTLVCMCARCARLRVMSKQAQIESLAQL